MIRTCETGSPMSVSAGRGWRMVRTLRMRKVQMHQWRAARQRLPGVLEILLDDRKVTATPEIDVPQG